MDRKESWMFNQRWRAVVEGEFSEGDILALRILGSKFSIVLLHRYQN
jgi:hypothetical protein